MNAEAKRFDILRNIVTARETKFSAELTKVYTQVFKEVKKEMQVLASKMPNGIFTRSEVFKGARYRNLIKSINSDLKILDDIKVFDYLGSQYEFSQLYTSFIVETEYQVKLSTVLSNKRQVASAVRNPLAKVSLQNNRKSAIIGIKKAITNSIARGEGINKMAAGIKKSMEGNLNNTFRIARTETTRVMGAAEEQQILETSKEIQVEKGWLATLDAVTRDTHRELDETYVLVGQPFANGLMYPGDQSGAASEVVNCRCTLTTRLMGFETAQDSRRARGLDGKNALVPDTNFKTWAANAKG
jgi:SPP1 gp7 family putative phage head morphogenesis protein